MYTQHTHAHAHKARRVYQLHALAHDLLASAALSTTTTHALDYPLAGWAELGWAGCDAAAAAAAQSAADAAHRPHVASHCAARAMLCCHAQRSQDGGNNREVRFARDAGRRFGNFENAHNAGRLLKCVLAHVCISARFILHSRLARRVFVFGLNAGPIEGTAGGPT